MVAAAGRQGEWCDEVRMQNIEEQIREQEVSKVEVFKRVRPFHDDKCGLILGGFARRAGAAANRTRGAEAATGQFIVARELCEEGTDNEPRLATGH